MLINLSKISRIFRCPKCGEGKIFCGLLTVNEKCDNCGLKIGEHDAGDGPAYIVMTIVSFLVCGLAVYVELAYTPSYWLHLALWVPAVIISSILLLKITKAYLIASEYKFSILKDNGN